MTVTPLRINVWAALFALTLMFGGTLLGLSLAISNAEVLGCSAGEVVLTCLGILSAEAAGVVYVVKQMTSDKGGNE